MLIITYLSLTYSEKFSDMTPNNNKMDTETSENTVNGNTIKHVKREEKQGSNNNEHRHKRVYRCQKCAYKTDRKNNLKRHIATMHEICDKVLECCGQIFANKSQLRNHVLERHRQGYVCGTCGRNFCRKALLKRHITVHSGQKDYVCGICGYATSHKSNLDRHKRRHYPRELRVRTTKPEVDNTHMRRHHRKSLGRHFGKSKNDLDATCHQFLRFFYL